MGGVASTDIASDGELTGDPEFPTKTHLYYALSRALLRGYTTSTREASYTAIPIELVIQIFDLAGIIKPNPTPYLTVHASVSFRVESWGPLKRELLLSSPPLTSSALAHVRQVRLDTVSRDQGWVNDPNAGNWTWFELQILQPAKLHDSDKRKITGQSEFIDPRESHPPFGGNAVDAGPTPSYGPKLNPSDATKLPQWVSHRNVPGSTEYQELEGNPFGPEHELWLYIQQGDVIGVYACAQFAGWQNIVSGGRLLFWERFDPMGLDMT